MKSAGIIALAFCILAIAVTADSDCSILVAGSVSGRVLSFQGDPTLLAIERPIGSLIKPFLLLAALETGRIRPEMTVFCLPAKAGSPRCWLHEGHGSINCSRALACSCVPFFKTVARATPTSALDDVCLRHGVFAKPFAWPKNEEEKIDAMIGERGGPAASPLAFLSAFLDAFGHGKRPIFRLGANGIVTQAVSAGKMEKNPLVFAGLRQCCKGEGTAHIFETAIPSAHFRGKTGTIAKTGWFVGVDDADSADPVAVLAVCRPGTGPVDAAKAAALAAKYALNPPGAKNPENNP